MEQLMAGIVFGLLLLLGIGLLAISFTVKVNPQQILIVATSKEQTPIVYRRGRRFLLPMYHRHAVFSLEPMEFTLHSRTKAHSGELIDSNISIGVHFFDDQSFASDVLFTLIEYRQSRLEEVARSILMRGIQQTIQSRKYAGTYQHNTDLFMNHLNNCCRFELQENGLKLLKLQILNLSPTIEDAHAAHETDSQAVAKAVASQIKIIELARDSNPPSAVKPMVLNFNFQDIPEKENIPLTIPVRFAIGETDDSQLSGTAARELAGLTDTEIEAKTRIIVEERFPKAIRSMTIKDINRSREWFYQGLIHEINSGLHPYGLSVINITVSDITDSVGIIEAMRAKALEEYQSQRGSQ